MWKCPKCGTEIEDQFDKCWRCVDVEQSFEPDQQTEENIKPTNGENEMPVCTQVKYAGFWLRVVAFIIDCTLLFAVIFGIGIVLHFRCELSENTETFFNLIGFIGMWFYHIFMESSKYQGTLGKMAVGIIVTDLDGKPITHGQAGLRYLAKTFCAFIGLGYLMAGITEKKQALHDMLTSCLVIKRGVRGT